MTDAAITWQRLRLKIGTSDDTDWRGTQTTPNTLTALVGGTADDGDYSITLVGSVHLRHSGTLTVNTTVTFTRAAAETSAQVAAALELLLDAATITEDSPVTLAGLGITASVDTATITLRFPPNASIVTSSEAPGTGTITWAIGTIVPITASAPLYARGGTSAPNAVAIIITAMDDAGETVLVPEDGGSDQTMVIEAIEICQVQRVVDGVVRYENRIASIETITGALLNTEYILQLRGAAHWTTRLLTFANNITNVDSYEVAWRDAAV